MGSCTALSQLPPTLWTSSAHLQSAAGSAAGVIVVSMQQRQPRHDSASWYTQLVQLPPPPVQEQQEQQRGAAGAAAADSMPQQQQQQHVEQDALLQPSSSSSSRQRTQTQLLPFAPVKFASKTHLLDPNTPGTLTLPPKAAAAESSSSGRQRQHQQRNQQQQQPHHPVAPAHIASSKRPIDRSNVGFKLLAKAGWQEGQGLGANEQGMSAPLALTYNKGSLGLGFNKQQQQQQHPPDAAAAAAAAGRSGDATGQAAAAAAGAAAGPVLGSKRVAALVAAELAVEDLDTKVRRHRQLQATKAKAERDKAIESYLCRAFNEADAPESNPLIAKSHRLTATNPLLD